MLLAIISLLSGLFYLLLFRYFSGGWRKLPEFRPSQNPAKASFTIIVPARNEEGNIIATLNGLVKQDYTGPFEIIVADDHSEDGTARSVSDFITQNPDKNIRLLQMADIPAETRAHKKAAINAAIAQSKYDWIVTTDADCSRGPQWLSTLAHFIAQQEPVLVSMPVQMWAGDSFFSKAQALEFLGLIGIGAASIGNGAPNMCNGANLCYRKEAFYAVNGYQGIDDIASGDDELLMHKIFARWPQGIFFLKNRDALVETMPVQTLPQFIAQRKRWVSKSRKYDRKSITAVMVGAYIFNLCIVIALITGFLEPRYFLLFALLLALKWLAEWPFLKRVTGFFGQAKMMRVFFTGSLLHIPYVLFIGIYGNFGKYNWKGRTLK